MKPCVHFIGFKNERQWRNAIRIFGQPDFVHRHWDIRAKFGGEYHPSDILVFAVGTENEEPRPFAFNDSEQF